MALSAKWTSDHGHFVSEFKDLQASAMAVDYLGNWCLLAGRKHLAFVNLKRRSQPIKVTRQSKWDIGCVQWNVHASCAYRFVTACNQRLDVFDLREASASHLCSMKAHSRTVSDIDWSPFDVNVVASCSVDTFTYFWDVRISKKPVKSFQTVTGAYQVKWNKVDNNLFATTHDGDVRIWDPRKGNTPVQYIAAHPSKIHGLDWSSKDQHKFVTASQDCTIRLWDFTSPQRSETLINSGNPVWRARYTPFGDGIVSVGVPQLRRGEYSLFLWHPREQVPVHTFMGHKDVILDFQWRGQQDGMRDHHLVTWSKDQSLRMWKVDPVLQKQCGHDIDPSTNSGIDELTFDVTDDETSWLNSPADKSPDSTNTINTEYQVQPKSSQDYHKVDVSAETRVTASQATVPMAHFSARSQSNSASPVRSGHGLAPGDSRASPVRGSNGLAPGDSKPKKGSWPGSTATTGGQVDGGFQGLLDLHRGVWGGTINVGGVGGAAAGFPVSLEQEIDEIKREAIPGIKLDHADRVKRVFVFKMAKGVMHMDAQLFFPDHYPVKMAPKLTVLASNLSPDVESRTIKAFNELCTRHVKQNKNCIEPGLRLMLQNMEKPSEQTQEDRKFMLEKKFAVEKVQLRSPTSPVTPSSGGIPMFPTGSFQDSCIPFPRTCGARFCANDRLVTFNVPLSLKKVHEESEVTPRALSDLIAYVMSQSQWMRNQSNSFAPMGLFYGSSPHSSTEGVSISSFYIDKTNKGRHPRHHHQSHYKSQYRGRESSDMGSNNKRASTGSAVAVDREKKQQKVGPVKIYNVTCINPVSRELAERYRLDMNDISGTCEHNTAVARAHDRMDLAQMWQLVSLMSHPGLRPSPNSDHGPPFAYTPFGRPLLKRMLDHYAKQRDVQTMAMLCCVFWDGNLPSTNVRDIDCLTFPQKQSPTMTAGAQATPPQLIRDESRTSLEYNATAAINNNRSSYEAVIKNKRSSSWSESYDDFRLQDDKDPRERAVESERMQHYDNTKMLEPELWHQYEQIKHSYADILFQWGLLNERRQILKQTLPSRAEVKSIEVNVSCWNCSEEVRGVQCKRCSYPALQCSICHIGVRGVANMCIACGHGGHLSHMADWFSKQDVCASGCGCHCLQENIVL